MPTFDIVRKSTAPKTFRVESVIGMFDLQGHEVVEHFKGDITLPDEWNIGVIYGHSGTGKTTIAKELFGEHYITTFEYKADAVIDDMPKGVSVKDIVRVFNQVGFSSPPSWIKPYHVLSNGEKMRVDLARAILEERELIVFDEFTSVVDRTVAKIGSAALAKAVRRMNKKFIAISCHDDIIEWLEPDWVFNTNNMKMEYVRGRLRRPEITIEIYEEKGKWDLFRKYHYLNHEINKASRQFVGYYDGKECCFCAVLPQPTGRQNPNYGRLYRVTRLVVIPDYQGLGIGKRMLDFVARLYRSENKVLFIVTSQPALMHSLSRDKHWRLNRLGRVTSPNSKNVGLNKTLSTKRVTSSWYYIA